MEYDKTKDWDKYQRLMELSDWCDNMAIKKKKDKNLKTFYKNASIAFRNRALEVAGQA